MELQLKINNTVNSVPCVISLGPDSDLSYPGVKSTDTNGTKHRDKNYV